MKKVLASFGLLVLVATMVMGGAMTSPAAAQDDPEILYKIAKNAQDQIRNNISESSSDKVKSLFEEGSNQVVTLSKALGNNDSESAKKHFLEAMKIFKKISHMLIAQNGDTPKAEMAKTQKVDDPASDLLKLYRYATSLKTIAEKHHTSIDFTTLNNLFTTAKEQINSGQLDDAKQSVQKIKQVLDDIEKQLRDQASSQESERAKKYAQKYLEQLDRLIESAKSQGISQEIIQKLEDARERLSSATDPEKIVKEIREIISIKDQFKLTKNDRLESRIMQVEKTLLKLSQIEEVDPDTIEDAEATLQEAKHLLSDGEFEKANELLRSLISQLKEIAKSHS